MFKRIHACWGGSQEFCRVGSVVTAAGLNFRNTYTFQTFFFPSTLPVPSRCVAELVCALHEFESIVHVEEGLTNRICCSLRTRFLDMLATIEAT
jgi:hypothetical protein